MTAMPPHSAASGPQNRWLPPLFRFLFRWRAAVLVFTSALTLGCLLLASQLNLREDILDLLPHHDPLIAQYRQILADFGQLSTLLIVVGPADEQSPVAEAELSAAADQLTARLQASHHFKQITSRLDIQSFSQLLETLRRHRANLFTAQDEAALSRRLTPESVRALLAGWKKQLLESPAPVIAQAFQRDPLGMDEFLLEKLNAIQPQGGPINLQQGRLFSRDMRHLLIMAEPVIPATDSLRARELVEFMDRSIAEVEARPTAGPRLKIAYLSGHRFSLENADRIKRDVKLTLSICILAIAGLSLLIYRRPRWVAFTLLPSLFGGIFALGLLRLLNPGLSAIAVGCGSMLMGIAVDLGIHILYHFDQFSGEGAIREKIIATLDRLFWPLILCSATTIVAFVSLIGSILPGYRDLGWFAVFGFAGATGFAIFILPLLIPQSAPVRTRQPLLPALACFPIIFEWFARHRRKVGILLLVLSLAAAPGLFRLHFESDYQKINAVSPAVRQDWDRVISVCGSALQATSIVVRGQSAEESLQMNERLHAALGRLQAEGVLQSFQTLAPLLPSLATQRQNSQRWQAFWDPLRIETLRAMLTREGQSLGLRPSAFESFFKNLTLPDTAPLTLEELQGSRFGHLLSMHVASAPDHPILTRVSLKNSEQYGVMLKALSQANVRHVAYNGPQFMQHVIRLIYREMLRISAITAGLVLLILIAYYRSLRWVALIIMPLLLSLLWTFGLMGWLGIRINLMNSMVVVFIFGVVVDYSLFLAASLSSASGRGDPHLSQTSVATVTSALTTMIGLGVLVFARHPALFSIGLTALLGIGTGLLAVFLFIPLASRTGSRKTPQNIF